MRKSSRRCLFSSLFVNRYIRSTRARVCVHKRLVALTALLVLSDNLLSHQCASSSRAPSSMEILRATPASAPECNRNKCLCYTLASITMDLYIYIADLSRAKIHFESGELRPGFPALWGRHKTVTTLYIYVRKRSRYTLIHALIRRPVGRPGAATSVALRSALLLPSAQHPRGLALAHLSPWDIFSSLAASLTSGDVRPALARAPDYVCI